MAADARWVPLCTEDELPAAGALKAFPVESRAVCVVNRDGVYAAIDNLCPHRQGPLDEGWLEDGRVVCPWHAWAFDPQTGCADHDAAECVAVFPLLRRGGEMLIDLR